MRNSIYLFLLLFFSVISCKIEKRLHNKGYYIETKRIVNPSKSANFSPVNPSKIAKNKYLIDEQNCGSLTFQNDKNHSLDTIELNLENKNNLDLLEINLQESNYQKNDSNIEITRNQKTKLHVKNKFKNRHLSIKLIQKKNIVEPKDKVNIFVILGLVGFILTLLSIFILVPISEVLILVPLFLPPISLFFSILGYIRTKRKGFKKLRLALSFLYINISVFLVDLFVLTIAYLIIKGIW